MATATTEPVRLPPGPRIPKIVQGIAFLLANHGMFAASGPTVRQRDHSQFADFGQAVVISDPILVKDVFSTSNDLIERPTYGVAPLLARYSALVRCSALPAMNTSRAADW